MVFEEPAITSFMYQKTQKRAVTWMGESPLSWSWENGVITVITEISSREELPDSGLFSLVLSMQLERKGEWKKLKDYNSHS